MQNRPSRRELLTLGAATTALSREAESQEVGRDFELMEATVHDLNMGLSSGKWTSIQLVQAYLERIEAIDHGGPKLKSVIVTNPDNEAAARNRDAERRDGKVRGPLHGIPVLVKDNLATHDRMPTTAGSLALEGCIPSRDSFVVRKLRAAGAIILGKANLSEWANFRSTHSSSGWSAVGGQTLNPYALNRSPSGSSSGTGSAIAANLCALGIGTETDGSITSPASAAGLVGIKPTVGLVSRQGIVPISSTQDTAGPMCRTVADASLLLAAIAGPDPGDSTTRKAPRQVEYSHCLRRDGLKGARLGICRAKFTGYDPQTDRLFEAALKELKKQGAVLIDPADIPHVGDYDSSELEVMYYEFKKGLADYFKWVGPSCKVKSIVDVIAFNRKHRAKEMPYFDQEIMEIAAEKGPLTDPAYRRALRKNIRLSRKEGIDAVMNQHHLDALVAPTQMPAWCIDHVLGDHLTGGFTSPAAVAGYPHITVPMGQVMGLPVGLSFVGRGWTEGTLIRLAFAYEQATLHRKPPKFIAFI